MSDQLGYEIGQIVNGHRWNGHVWEPVDPGATYQIGQIVNGHQWNGQAWEPADPGTTSARPDGEGPGFALPPGSAGGSATSPARAAAGSFWFGALIALGVSAASYSVVHSLNGGIVWYGGYFLTLAAWRRAWRQYRAARALTGQSMTPRERAATAIGVALALGSAVLFGVAWASQSVQDANLSATVGSCWAEQGAQEYLVNCSDSSVTYRAVGQAPTGQEQQDCPPSTVVTIASDDPTVSLCLAPR